MRELKPAGIDPKDCRVAIVVSQFNQPVTDKLLAGALDALRHAKLPEQNVLVTWVPGAFELPLASQALASLDEFQAIIALGCVIRGETGHYDQVCDQTAAGLMRVSLDCELPVIFGVVTTENGDQAMARAGGAKGNKGADAAATALHMAGLLSAFQQLD